MHWKHAKKKPISPGVCKFCGSKDVFWDNTEDKSTLIEPYGLPHVCQERMDISNAKKQEYAFYKEKINSIKADTKCTLCPADKTYCSECHGYGSFSRSAKRNLLARKRNELWPNLNS